jgi:hypothetical protein
MKWLRRGLRQLVNWGKVGVRFAPIEVTVGIALAVVFTVAIARDEGSVWDDAGRLLAAAAFAWPVVLSLSVLVALGRVHAVLRVAGSALVLAGALFWCLDADFDLETTPLHVVENRVSGPTGQGRRNDTGRSLLSAKSPR